MFDQTPDRWSVSSGIQTTRRGLKGGAEESFSFTDIKVSVSTDETLLCHTFQKIAINSKLDKTL